MACANVSANDLQNTNQYICPGMSNPNPNPNPGYVLSLFLVQAFNVRQGLIAFIDFSQFRALLDLRQERG